MGGEGGDGLPQADEDEIHGGGRPPGHVRLRPSSPSAFTGCDEH